MKWGVSDPFETRDEIKLAVAAMGLFVSLPLEFLCA